MRNAYIYHRYRKWNRKAFGRKDPQALRKWAYWHKLYGNHVCLWRTEP